MKRTPVISWSRCKTTKRPQISPLSCTNVERGSRPWRPSSARWNNSFYAPSMHRILDIKVYVMALALITRFTLQEAIRRRLFLAVLILSALLLVAFIILLSIAINLIQSNSSTANGDTLSPHLFLVSGGVFFDILMTWLVYLLSSLLTIVLTANMISGEVEAGTFAVIVAKPIILAEIVMGKWLCCAFTFS